MLRTTIRVAEVVRSSGHGTRTSRRMIAVSFEASPRLLR